jgi:hypothetical protein
VNITVTVDEVTLDTVLHEYDGEQTTVGDQVAFAIMQKLVSDRDVYPLLRKRVSQIRDEEIRAAVTPLITETLTRPFRQTNGYGEAAGPETTLSALIVAEAKALMTKPADAYSRSGQTVLGKIVAEEVSRAFKTVVADEVKRAKAEVAAQIGAMVAESVAAGMRK